YVDVMQSEYNLLHREAEKDLFPYTAQESITFIPYSPLKSGLLTGKYDENTTFSDFRASKSAFQGDNYKQNLKKVEQLRKIAKEKEAEVSHIVLAWYFSRLSIEVIIPGAKRSEQVMNNLKVTNLLLNDDEIDKIDKFFS